MEPSPVRELAAAVRAALIAFPCEVCSGASVAEIEAFEARYGVTLTDELREALQVFNGTELGDFGEHITQFYSLDLIRSLPDLADEDGIIFDPPLVDLDRYYVFADVMLRSEWLAFHLPVSPSSQSHLMTIWLAGRSEIICHHRYAESFAEFLSVYLKDPDCVLNFNVSDFP